MFLFTVLPSQPAAALLLDQHLGSAAHVAAWLLKWPCHVWALLTHWQSAVHTAAGPILQQLWQTCSDLHAVLCRWNSKMYASGGLISTSVCCCCRLLQRERVQLSA